MDASHAPAAIDVDRMTFGWPDRPAVLDIERFVIERGERVFLRGPSGSGKSTLLALIAGVLTPTSGRVQLLGVPTSATSAGQRDRFRGDHVGFVFQMFNLIPYLRVLENVLLPLRFSATRASGLRGASAEAEGRRLLASLGLHDESLLDRSVAELSMGQQQRVAAARALIGRPEIVIADEPTSALDADAREEFLQLLLNECQAAEAALLFVSHDLSLGQRFDRVVSMSEINAVATST